MTILSDTMTGNLQQSPFVAFVNMTNILLFLLLLIMFSFTQCLYRYLHFQHQHHKQHNIYSLLLQRDLLTLFIICIDMN